MWQIIVSVSVFLPGFLGFLSIDRSKWQHWECANCQVGIHIHDSLLLVHSLEERARGYRVNSSCIRIEKYIYGNIPL